MSYVDGLLEVCLGWWWLVLVVMCVVVWEEELKVCGFVFEDLF